MLFTNVEIEEVLVSLETEPQNSVETRIQDILVSTALATLKSRMWCFRNYTKHHKISISIIWEFPEWWGNRNSLAKSIVTKEGDAYLVFALSPWMEERNVNWSEVKKTALHEAFHVVQMEWIYRHGGPSRLNWILSQCYNIGYWENPMEIGAYGFERNPESYLQNFAEAFDL